jgi:hypothetical protein
MKLPGFTAEDSIYQKNHAYQGLALSSSIFGDGGIRPEACVQNPDGSYRCCNYNPYLGYYTCSIIHTVM